MMKRLAFFLAIAIIALCLFSSAYSKRSDQTGRQSDEDLQMMEVVQIEVELDKVADRMKKLEADMDIVKNELLKSRDRSVHRSE